MLQFLTCRMDLAARYGIDAAVFLHNVVYWTLKNKAEDRHFYEGRYWMNASLNGLAALYPLWSMPQIRRMIAKLREGGALLVGDFNEDRMVRTNWYAPSDEILAIYETGTDGPALCRNRQMHETKPARGVPKSANANKDKEESKEDIPPISPQGTAAVCQILSLCQAYAGEDGELMEAITGLLENRAAANKKPVRTAKAMNGILKKLDRLSGGDRALKLALLEKATVSGWLTVFPLKEDELPQPGAVSYNMEGYDGI